MKIKVLAVSEVNNYIKKITENDFILNNLSVKGEISNLKYHSSGHIYFSLKDDFSKINCIMFKSDAIELDFKLKEGLDVIIKGRVSIYPQNGSLQLYCREIEEVGLGDLHVKFEKLKKKLYDEGLFDEKYKKDIPINPSRIGVVTAETGAAIRDIINVTRRRNKGCDIVLYPAKVQGEGGFNTIIEGIEYFNKKKSVEVIIIGRGGGSLEELWNFNEEKLAYAIFNSKLPIISAVGHEVDFTISDFVADVRAATPSQGAEIAVINTKEIEMELKSINTLLNKKIESIIENEKRDLKGKFKLISLNSPKVRISNSFLEIDSLKEELNRRIREKLEKEKMKISEYNNLLNANNPLNILDKGFSVIKRNGITIKETKELLKSENIEIVLKDGSVSGKFKANGGEDYGKKS
ncbi:exodeoxyribonuclease VII large subunit [Clostridium thermobutyricum]|uniref:Exodeoxyribonuclease 7 large subunit n=1 Tax=Clostridium thermobutyricum DSM 4928 TaxID=1121339 RepID=A0A1V4SWS5_9CLOT|nr:exodeoxyribonuclease VII large subunit [Clostridium thermobutyricum]OPX47872.1 exodeoxyribonuclease 7 large subunit [Clostridium thermobutyricum DSM 4928]